MDRACARVESDLEGREWVLGRFLRPTGFSVGVTQPSLIANSVAFGW